MIKTKFTKTLLIAAFALIFITSCASAATIDVGSGYTYSTIGSGMAAASSGDTVHVHAGTYTLTSPVTLKTGVTLYGDGYDSTIVRATDKAKFASEAEPAMFFGSSVSNVVIYGFKFQGPASSIADIHDEDQTYYGGHDDYHIAIRIKTGTNIRIHDCYATLLIGDFVRASGTSYLYVYNNIVNTCGHDGGQLYNVKNTLWYNNYVNVLMNTGVRVSDSSGGNNTVRQNTFTNGLANSGWCSVQLQGSSTGILVEKNVFTRTTDNYPCAGYSYTGSGSTIRNNIGYSTPSTFLYNLASATTSNNSVYTSEHDWAAWGYGYDADSTTGGGGGAVPDPDPGNPAPIEQYDGDPLPTQVSPAAGATVAPVNGRVSFSWSNVGSSNYQLQVATDSAFSVLIADTTTASTALSVAVNNGTTYYWHMRAYNDAGSAWTTYTSTRTVTTTTSVAKVVGVYGTVYTSIAKLPVPGAVVTMSNDSWSGAYVTGDNGYYEFSVLSSTGVYYITVSATDYMSPQYQLPVNASDYVEKNIALSKSPTYFAPHNVKFIVTDNYLMNRYSANIALYTEGSNEPIYNASTGSDGSVTFELEEDVRYRAETTYGGITNIDYIVPADTKYYIIIDTSGITLVNEQLYDNITANVSKNEINTTTAYINASYLDNSSRTTNVTYILGHTEENGTFVEEANSGAIAGSNSTHAFTVNDYLGKDYVMKLEINHTAFGHRTKAFAVAFSGNTSPFSGYKEMAYLAVFILFIVATQFGKQEHASGSIVLCAMAWLMWFLGMFRPLGDTLNGMIFAGAVAATVYAIISYINSTREGSY